MVVGNSTTSHITSRALTAKGFDGSSAWLVADRLLTVSNSGSTGSWNNGGITASDGNRSGVGSGLIGNIQPGLTVTHHTVIGGLSCTVDTRVILTVSNGGDGGGTSSCGSNLSGSDSTGSPVETSGTDCGTCFGFHTV